MCVGRRFHPPLIYGRRGDPVQEDGEGVAVCRVAHKTSGRPLFCLITYVYPTLSARAVPQLKDFCESQRTCRAVCSHRLTACLIGWE